MPGDTTRGDLDDGASDLRIDDRLEDLTDELEDRLEEVADGLEQSGEEEARGARPAMVSLRVAQWVEVMVPLE